MDSQERKQAMLHLLRNVVNFEDESIAEKGLERSNALDVGSFMALTSDSIKEMQYRDAQAGRSARNLPIGAGNAHALYQLQCFLRFVSMKLNNQLAELNDFTHLTQARYNHYVMQEHIAFLRELHPPDANTAAASSTPQ